MPHDTREAASGGERGPGVPASWRCPECRCMSYARVTERKPDGDFGPGPMIRCVDCKSVFDTRPMTNPTDLAARFEAKREEYELKERATGTQAHQAYWLGRASAFVDARDMARAGAAGHLVPAPLPHPQAPNTLSEVEEAETVLGKLDPEFGPPERYVKFLRHLDFNDHADRIEAALATLHASQEQDVEVSDA